LLKYGDPQATALRVSTPQTYKSAHQLVGRTKGPATGYLCVDCGHPARQWSYDGRDDNERIETRNGNALAFSVNPLHYQARCLACHREYDDTPNRRLF
jgi:hypothetical protein